jgi:hypothetical protein
MPNAQQSRLLMVIRQWEAWEVQVGSAQGSIHLSWQPSFVV